ncbi:MAG: hypothetical protein IT159_03535 [Bryobacterales bacterium]|nr:hypothetical protein [Bryobacterales bacterium]
MNVRHWTDDELLGRLYGLGPNDGHLEACEECARRWRAVRTVRAEVLEPPPVSEEFLAAQRRLIRDRLDSAAPRRGRLRFIAAAAAAAAVVCLAIVLHRPTPFREAGISDAELYAEVYSLIQLDEPLAIQPVHAIFEVEP